MDGRRGRTALQQALRLPLPGAHRPRACPPAPPRPPPATAPGAAGARQLRRGAPPASSARTVQRGAGAAPFPSFSELEAVLTSVGRRPCRKAGAGGSTASWPRWPRASWHEVTPPEGALPSLFGSGLVSSVRGTPPGQALLRSLPRPAARVGWCHHCGGLALPTVGPTREDLPRIATPTKRGCSSALNNIRRPRTLHGSQAWARV